MRDKQKTASKKAMKKSIHMHFLLVGAVAIILTVLFSIVVFYKLFRQQVFQDLENYSELLQGPEYLARVKQLSILLEEDKQRVTVIDSNGFVLFDSNAATSRMDNHKERPEIRQAARDGSGYSVRHSKTLGRSTYYYAKRMEDGNILRVALETNDAMSFFYRVFPVFFCMVGIIFLFCFLMAKYLTKRIVRPIGLMAENIGHIEELAAYEELVPFARIIKEQHEDITKKMLVLEKSSRFRQDFTANVSHELKTPLTVVSGYAELMEAGMAQPEDVRHFAGEIHRNAARLLTLINDIIQLAELDTEEVELEKKSFDLYLIAKRCVKEMELKAQKHKVKLFLNGTEGACVVEANPDMIEEMLTNLCDNAIRYNRPLGTVTVTVKKVSVQEYKERKANAFIYLPATDDKTNVEDNEKDAVHGAGALVKERICLIVEDTGIGIPIKHQERIFERFYRVDKSRSKATGGTGLGLAIVKHIAARNKAELLLDSTENKGTRIEVWF